MIGITFQGRLGNQLFQYAFAVAISKSTQVSFYMDQSQHRGVIYDYFELPNGFGSFLARRVFTIKGFKNLLSHHLRRFVYRSINFCCTNSSIVFDFENRILPATIADKSLLIGYFQSESYFVKYKSSIIELFELKKEYSKKHNIRFATLYKEKKIATVHIRKSDYQNLGHLNLGSADLSLPFSYYHKVIAQLKTEDYLFIFTSDEPTKVETEFSYLKHKLVSYDNEITDFQHMMNANICIIANSTFSWWGAYLNNRPDKIIYCPKYFLGIHKKETLPLGIYPDEWVQID